MATVYVHNKDAHGHDGYDSDDEKDNDEYAYPELVPIQLTLNYVHTELRSAHPGLNSVYPQFNQILLMACGSCLLLYAPNPHFGLCSIHIFTAYLHTQDCILYTTIQRFR